MMPIFAERLRVLLPDVYLVEDTTGDLWAFLHLIGMTLDQVQAGIADMPKLADVERCPPDFLPWLAGLVGVTYDPFATPESQRRTIREAIERYRRIGTLLELQRELRTLGWQGEIRETHRQVLRLGTRSRLNRQKLPGQRYNLGVYTVTGVLLGDAQMAEVLDHHHPAGTRRWTEA
jgi:phage tail-like protein